MGQRRQAERSARKHEREHLTGAFRTEALSLADVFPDLAEGPGLGRGRLAAAAWGAGLSLREEEGGLRLTCAYHMTWNAQPERGRTLTYTQVLALIRSGGLVPDLLELVLAPAEATGAWSLEQAQRVTFSYGDWRLVGWEHWSDNKIARAHARWYQRGMEVSFADPFITLHFRLAPKVQNLTRQRLLAARGLFDRVFSAV
jgi:hypothetical protein